MVPPFLCPQELAAESQTVPNPVGFGGTTALQTPFTTAPLPTKPQEFAEELQETAVLVVVVVSTGQLEFEGVTAEHEPLQPIVPVDLCPQEFAVD